MKNTVKFKRWPKQNGEQRLRSEYGEIEKDERKRENNKNRIKRNEEKRP